MHTQIHGLVPVGEEVENVTFFLESRFDVIQYLHIHKRHIITIVPDDVARAIFEHDVVKVTEVRRRRGADYFDPFNFFSRSIS